jgi:hypothetical protein
MDEPSIDQSATDSDREATREGWVTGMHFINPNLCVIISPTGEK